MEPVPVGGADDGGCETEEPWPDAPDAVLGRSPPDPVCVEDPGIGLTERASPPLDELFIGETGGVPPSTDPPRPAGGCQPPSTEACHEVGGTNPLRPDRVEPSPPDDSCTEG